MTGRRSKILALLLGMSLLAVAAYRALTWMPENDDDGGRPTSSAEHPRSGAPQHDLIGGNMCVPYVLASAVSGSANYDAVNDTLLNQGPATLTLDLTTGEVFFPDDLLAGVDRAQKMLRDAAKIANVNDNQNSGQLSFTVVNQTGHKLISGFPKGRRMFVSIRFYDGKALLAEVNPYDAVADGYLDQNSVRHAN